MNPSWNRLIEASSNEIQMLARDLALPEPLYTYAQVLAAFLQGDSEKLTAICSQMETDNEDVCELARLRLALRRRELKPVELQRIEELEFTGVLLAEKYFCLGMGWEFCENDTRAHASFLSAAHHYRSHSCPRKGLRAHYNAVVAESRLRPHKSFIADYQAIIDASRAIADEAFEGIALAMLSREFQIVGLLDQALQMADDSLMRLQIERGTIHYFHSLLHKAHVLIELGRPDEVFELLNESQLAPFPAIHAARHLLSLNLDPALVWDRELERDLLPTWKNRLPSLLGKRPTVIGTSSPSDLEQTLLRLAYNGPVEKWDLIERLYPAGGDSLALENRFKNLVARVRKKYPSLLTCHEGRYSVARLPAVHDLL